MASSDPGVADPEPEPERAAAAQEDAAASSSDEEVDRRAFGIWQALPVPMRAPAWDVEELDSVEEYLCRVRWQAQSLPGTVVAKEVPSALDRPSSAAVPTELDEPEPCHPSLLPKAEWLADFVARFRLLRDRLQWELAREAEELNVALGTLGLGQETAEPQAAGAAPWPSIFDSMPELAALRPLKPPGVAQQIPSRVARLVKSGVTADVAAELFALSLRVEEPLRPDACAAYRRLWRHCSSVRASLAEGSQDDRLPTLTILIAIAGAIFHQGPVLTQ